jgi:hypothetical protein
MLGLGPMLDDEKASEISEQWGKDAVHPLQAAYATIASAMDSDISDDGARYINPPKSASGPPEKRLRVDHSKLRQDWVEGCSAALPRRDTISGQPNTRGNSARGRSRGSGHGISKPRSWTMAGRSGNGGRGRGGGRWWKVGIKTILLTLSPVIPSLACDVGKITYHPFFNSFYILYPYCIYLNIKMNK